MLPPPEGVERMVTECCACNCLKTYDARWRLQRNSVFVSVKKNPMIRKISGLSRKILAFLGISDIDTISYYRVNFF